MHCGILLSSGVCGDEVVLIFADGDEVFTHQYPFLAQDDYMQNGTRAGESLRVRLSVRLAYPCTWSKLPQIPSSTHLIIQRSNIVSYNYVWPHVCPAAVSLIDV